MTPEPLDSQTKEALEYWGYLLKPDKCGTELLNRLLSGIATFISQFFQPSECTDLTPSQLAEFYKAVGGDYDILFVETLPSSIAFIYKSLGCLHSLQPGPTDDGYSSPTIPALKTKGFITWQTIQLLLGPEEHVPFLQNAVEKFDIVDPGTGKPFPKLLPKEAFPEKPDDAMVQWYEGVSERLRQEAQAAEQQRKATGRKHEEDGGASTDASENSPDERSGAAEYFRNPLYRNHEGRPTIIRRYSKRPPRSPRQFVEDRGRIVVNTVRHMWNPWTRRRSIPEHYDDEDDAELDDLAPVAPPPRKSQKNSQRHPRRASSISSTASDDSELSPGSPVLRHRRSHDAPFSPREYFPPYYEHPRRNSAEPRKSDPVQQPSPTSFGPTKAPLFATEVARLQAQNQWDRRASVPLRSSHYQRPPTTIRYTMKEPSPRDRGPPSIHVQPERQDHPSRESSRRPSSDTRRGSGDPDRERRDHESDRHSDRARDRHRDRDREPARTHRYVPPEYGVGGRRYPVQAARRPVD